MRPTTVALTVLMLGLAVTGCSGDTSGTDGEDETVRVTLRGARIHTDSGAGLTVMLVSYPDVIVGSVTGIEDISDLKAFGYPVEEGQSFEGEPTRVPHRPGVDVPSYSRVTVRVESPISGDLTAGDEIHVIQRGGRLGNTLYEEEGDRLLEPGARYVLFLEEMVGYDLYWASTWGRQVVGDDGVLQPAIPGWDHFPVQKVLTGTSVDAAAALIATAEDEVLSLAAEGKLPVLPPMRWPPSE